MISRTERTKTRVVLSVFLISLGIFLMIVSGLAEASENSAVLDIRCRDARTGAPLNAMLTIVGPTTSTGYQVRIGHGGAHSAQLVAGEYNIGLSLAGYRDLTSTFTLAKSANLPVTYWLDAVSGSFDDAGDDDDGSVVISGYIYDATDGLPIPWAQVSLRGDGSWAEADNTGYFQLRLAHLSVPVDDELPSDMLQVNAPGYRTLERGPILLVPGRTMMIFDLERGQGKIAESGDHALLLDEEGKQLHQTVDGEEDLILDEEAIFTWYESMSESASTESTTSGLTVIAPPGSIRVGLSCSCTTCSTVSVMSLETYVKRGLNDEWISSWASHSLMSGAIAYRSYGAYYVANPIRTNYDICSSTCCQVNDSDTATSTNTAATATAGFMLQRTGTAFRSEYSAENNSWDDPNDGLSCVNVDLSCGNGYVGSPSASWPCLYDVVALGRGCFGHGRGMSQWGTQRWASTYGKLWHWITNHYFNASGSPSGYRSAYITTPVKMQSVAISPTTVAPGQSFTISFTGINYAESAHTNIMVGASIYSSMTGYISDTAHDKKVTLNAGTNSLSRLFTVPESAAQTSYNVLVSYYYDVDGNSSITSTDMSIALTTLPLALTVNSSSTVAAW